MARHLLTGLAIYPDPDGTLRAADTAETRRTVTLWTDREGGTQYIDLETLTGNATSEVTIVRGQWAALGPDGITGAWVDAGGPSRGWVTAAGVLPGVGGPGGGDEQLSVVDNGDGYLTISGDSVSDNGDGYITIGV